MGVLKEKRIKEGIPKRKFKKRGFNKLKNVKFKAVFRTADKFR